MSVTARPLPALPRYGPGIGLMAPDRRSACLAMIVPLAVPVGGRALVNGYGSLGWVAIFGPLRAHATTRTDLGRAAPHVEAAAEDRLNELKRANVAQAPGAGCNIGNVSGPSIFGINGTIAMPGP
ncbi:hypothetical protein [Streptomyces diastatochromogenes]|nr:hypothetical protein [Streptomyces diastatochromogenes]